MEHRNAGIVPRQICCAKVCFAGQDALNFSDPVWPAEQARTVLFAVEPHSEPRLLVISRNVMWDLSAAYLLRRIYVAVHPTCFFCRAPL